MKRALILGISGQDGAYLAQQLLQNNHQVFGTMPDASTRPFLCLQSLGILNKIRTFQLSQQDFPSVLRLLKTLRVDEIYNLSAQVECGTENALSVCEPNLEQGTLNVLEAMRILRNGERYLFVASGERTDLARQTGAQVLTENREPCDPALAAEAAAARQVALYRAQFGVYACTGVFYNRDSPLQTGFALSRRISAAAARIARGSTEMLQLDHQDEVREWGWAPEYTVAMHRILQQPVPGDFVPHARLACRDRDGRRGFADGIQRTNQGHTLIDYPAADLPAGGVRRTAFEGFIRGRG